MAFVLCLDTLGTSNELNMHVSKPPREDSVGGQFYKVSGGCCQSPCSSRFYDSLFFGAGINVILKYGEINVYI